MVEIKFVKANQLFVDELKDGLRLEDEQECLAASNQHASFAMQAGFNNSTLCWVGLIGGKPFNCFGVAPSGIEGLGVPWMLGTNDIKNAARGIAKNSEIYIGKMLDAYPKLLNWVDARNLISIYWLKRCGFNIEPPTHYGHQNKLFHRFHINKEDFYV